jgi:hypothetical protein
MYKLWDPRECVFCGANDRYCAALCGSLAMSFDGANIKLRYTPANTSWQPTTPKTKTNNQDKFKERLQRPIAIKFCFQNRSIRHIFPQCQHSLFTTPPFLPLPLSINHYERGIRSRNPVWKVPCVTNNGLDLQKTDPLRNWMLARPCDATSARHALSISIAIRRRRPRASRSSSTSVHVEWDAPSSTRSCLWV